MGFQITPAGFQSPEFRVSLPLTLLLPSLRMLLTEDVLTEFFLPCCSLRMCFLTEDVLPLPDRCAIFILLRPSDVAPQ